MKNGELSDAMKAVVKALRKEAAEKKEHDYKQWCDDMAGLPADFERLPKAGWLIDHEFQPIRWMSDGLEVLRSSKGAIQLNSDDEERKQFLEAYLPYPIFQMGTELFLKGMWLCQHDDCRKLTHFGYIDPARRKALARELKDLGHDLLKLIDKNKLLAPYQSSPEVTRFLKVTEGIVRFFYYPIYETSRRDWAGSRYPKRFYDDTLLQGGADAQKSYPHHWLLIRLFEETEARIDSLWKIRKTLSSKS